MADSAGESSEPTVLGKVLARALIVVVSGGGGLTGEALAHADRPAYRTTMSKEPQDQTVWQESDGWHVRLKPDGPVTVFKTREEAIAFSVSAFTDGGSAARAEVAKGDAQMPPNPPQEPAKKTGG